MATKILITGASGFIGRHLVEEALLRNMEVYAAVRETSSRKYLTDPRIRFFPFDMDQPDQLLNDLKCFQEDMGGFQFVIHNAAITVPKDVSEFISGNADFTREFARMLMETQIGLRKFVFMSSMASIGPGDPVSMKMINEKHARRPVTPYGHSKLLAERFIHEIEELPYVILRPTGVYGPGDVKFALRVIGMLKQGLELSIGPADQQTSYVHADDVSRVALDACLSKVVREDFNIADGRFYTQKEFNGFLKKALGKRTIAVRIPTRLMVASGFAVFHLSRLTNKPVRLSHAKMREITARNWKVDITKARELLGFQPKFDLERGLQDVADSLE
jgi:nucleoside-diphosphate-sugar epimerase